MEIQLSKTIEVRTSITTDIINYGAIIDNQDCKVVYTDVVLAVDEQGMPISKQLILWQNEDYDQVGQWTDEQAIQRIKDLLES